MSVVFDRRITRDCRPEEWGGSRLVVFAACDVAYAANAKALIRSMDAVSPGNDFYLHLVNARQEVVDEILVLAEQLKSTRLFVSAEVTTLRSQEHKRTWYACARFVRLAEIMRQTETPILMVDADGLFVSPIDFDFTDKQHAQMCLPLRGGADESQPLHLRVAAGAIWVKPCPATCEFFDTLATDLVDEFSAGDPEWFIDQELLARHIAAGTGNVVAFNIKTKYVDWDFREDAIIWTGKGKRKRQDLGYVLLRSCFDSDPDRRHAARRKWRAIVEEIGADAGVLGRIFSAETDRARRRFAIYLPRLDLPWKVAAMGRGGPAAQSVDAKDLRLWWKRFAMELSFMLTRSGFDVSTVEIPAWEITPERVDADGYDFAFIPHRCKLDFEPGQTPVAFFMQEYFRHVFVVDSHGWSAASSVYPVDPAALPGAVLGAWDDYRARLARGELESKFSQAPRMSREELVARGAIPPGTFAFFPLQIPHDQSLLYFSDVTQLDALRAASEWARKTGMTLVLKEHPANRLSALEYRQELVGDHVFWSDAHLHDLIRHSRGVITMNSGAGFEAILIGKPVAAFARVEYDAVVHSAAPDTLADAWDAAVSEDADVRMTRYARFVDWFLARYAVDLSRPQSAAYSLDRVVARAVAQLGANANG
jgi:hypothetical protein